MDICNAMPVSTRVRKRRATTPSHYPVTVRGILDESDGKSYVIRVNNDTRIGQVKNIIYRAGGPRPQQQLIMHCQSRLKNNYTIGECGIAPRSVLRLIIYGRGVGIFVRLRDDTVIAINDCLPDDTVHDVKVKIREKTNIHLGQQPLVFGTRRLINTHKLHEYDIKKGDTIIMEGM